MFQIIFLHLIIFDGASPPPHTHKGICSKKNYVGGTKNNILGRIVRQGFPPFLAGFNGGKFNKSCIYTFLTFFLI